MNDKDYPSRVSADPFLLNVLESLPRDVRLSFTKRQVESLHQAFQRERWRSRHLVDVRFAIPLYLARLYAVVLVGKDRRRTSQNTASEYRQTASTLIKVLLLFGFVLVFSAVVLVAGFFFLYVLKSGLGINLFPDRHLSDFLW